MSLWQGHRGAVSLTFDDGLPCQIEHALPLLDRYGVKATFFLIQNSPYDRCFRHDVWRSAITNGHEIGSHSVNHRKAADLDQESAFGEAADSRAFLENALGGQVRSFCYPFTDAPPHLQAAARRAGYKQARAGRSARPVKYIAKGEAVNLLALPSYHVNSSAFASEEIFDWIDGIPGRNAWVTLMFHGVGPDDRNWDNIHSNDFEDLLIYLTQGRDLWIAPFGAAAQNFREFGR